MVFDPVTQTLFWMDTGNTRLMKMKVSSDGSHAEPEILHDLNGRVPYSIALDACNRYADVAFVQNDNRFQNVS